jgi:hypothetical protein
MADIGGRKGQDALALALASGQTIRDAAVAAGLGERTATRRVADPAFRQRIAALRSDMLARAAGQIADGMTQAVKTLRQLLSARSESVRLAAARSILEIGPRLHESLDLDERLREVEGRLRCEGNGAPP